ncbi:MAG TPA: PEP-CTERM sorting domain-containing protein [Pirellulales bacterium]
MRQAVRIGILVLWGLFTIATGASGAVVAWSLAITDDADQPITGPLVVGQTFWLDVSILDLRTDLGPNAGALSAATDILFDSTKVAPTGSVQPGVAYPVPTMQRMTIPTPDDMRVGGSVVVTVNGPVGPPGVGPNLLDRIEMVATAAGPITFATQIPFAQSVFVEQYTFATIAPNVAPFPVADADIAGATLSMRVVPEPGTLLLAFIAAGGLALRFRKTSKCKVG